MGYYDYNFIVGDNNCVHGYYNSNNTIKFNNNPGNNCTCNYSYSARPYVLKTGYTYHSILSERRC